MLKPALMMTALIGVFTGGSALAQAPAQEKIYGSQFMTQQQRIEYCSRLLAANSVDECAQIRKEHHARMKKRAKERGTMLPDSPTDGAMSPPISGMEQS